MPEERRSSDVGRLSPRLADAEIDRRLAEMDRQELPVNVGNVKQRHVTERIELEQVRFGEALLRHRTRERAITSQQCGGCGAELNNVPAGDHGASTLSAFTSRLRPRTRACSSNCAS